MSDRHPTLPSRLNFSPPSQQVILRPIFGLLVGDKVVVLTNPSDLLEYFDEDQLPPNFLETYDPPPPSSFDHRCRGVTNAEEAKKEEEGGDEVVDLQMKRDI
jgi:hypothetical protein